MTWRLLQQAIPSDCHVVLVFAIPDLYHVRTWSALDPHLIYGGARRDRTADLLHAMQALSQLSYSPKRPRARC